MSFHELMVYRNVNQYTIPRHNVYANSIDVAVFPLVIIIEFVGFQRLGKHTQQILIDVYLHKLRHEEKCVRISSLETKNLDRHGLVRSPIKNARSKNGA